MVSLQPLRLALQSASGKTIKKRIEAQKQTICGVCVATIVCAFVHRFRSFVCRLLTASNHAHDTQNKAYGSAQIDYSQNGLGPFVALNIISSIQVKRATWRMSHLKTVFAWTTRKKNKTKNLWTKACNKRINNANVCFCCQCWRQCNRPTE